MKKFSRWLKAAVVASLLVAPVARAGLNEAIWQVKLNGSLGIQDFNAKVEPRLQKAALGTRDFLRIVLGREANPSERLALNIDMRAGETNVFLSVFDRVERSSTIIITGGGTLTAMVDDENFTFTLVTNISSLLPNSRGGTLRLAGHGRMIQGVPSALKASLGGWIVDARPGDLGGTTGVVLRATIRTGKLLRP